MLGILDYACYRYEVLKTNSIGYLNIFPNSSLVSNQRYFHTCFYFISLYFIFHFSGEKRHFSY